jgi:glutamate---cysteine ligase / carboxylate-amine ligase
MTRRMGVEEEFLVVDGENGNPLPLGEVLEQLSDFPRLTSEMKQEQIETLHPAADQPLRPGT